MPSPAASDVCAGDASSVRLRDLHARGLMVGLLMMMVMLTVLLGWEEAARTRAQAAPCGSCGDGNRAPVTRRPPLADRKAEAAMRTLEARERWTFVDAQQALSLVEASGSREASQAARALIAQRLARPGSAAEDAEAWLRARTGNQAGSR